MKKLILLLAIIFTFVSPITVVFAQEPTAGSATDNACNPGGSMDGKCTTEWHWTCGWYIARWETGEFSPLLVPFSCSESLIIPYLLAPVLEVIFQSAYDRAYFPGN